MSTISATLGDLPAERRAVARPRVLRLRYNPVFLPEYFSTIVISLAISIPFLAVPMGGGVPIWKNPHAPLGLALYAFGLYLLLHLTFATRQRHRRLLVEADPDLGIVVRSGDKVVRLDKIDRCTLDVERFFGRRVRTIRLTDSQGHEIAVHDGLVGLDEFHRLLKTLLDRPIELVHHDPEQELEVADAWRERHAIFPTTVDASVARAVLRFFFLIPVAFVEFVSNLWLNFELVTNGLAILTVYCAPITLFFAAIVNRYVSYYLLTSRRMNR